MFRIVKISFAVPTKEIKDIMWVLQTNWFIITLLHYEKKIKNV